MKLKKNILISFLLALGYCCFSLYYFFGGLHNPVSESAFRTAIEAFVTLPGILIFSAAYGGSAETMYLTALITFLIIWLFALALTSVVSAIIKHRKSNTKEAI